MVRSAKLKRTSDQLAYDEIVDDFVDRCTLSAAFRNGFPNVVARDMRVTPALLTLLAYRSTYGDDRIDFALNEKALSKKPIVKPQSGLGKNNIRSAWALGKKLGYLRRWQPPGPSGRWNHAAEKLSLPSPGASGRAGQHLKRAWFDGSLSLKAMAAFLYFRAGGGNGPSLYASELAERFGWSRPTAAKVLKELLAHGLIDRKYSRSKGDGRFSGVTYAALRASHWRLWSTAKKPGNGLRCRGKTGDSRTSCLPHEPSVPLSRTVRETGHCPAPGRAGLPSSDFEISFSPLEPSQPLSDLDVAWASPNLLGAIDRGGVASDLWEVDPDTEEEMAAIASDAQLRRWIKEATGGRVSTEILSAAGLYAVRWLASLWATACFDADGVEREPSEALRFVLKAMRDRIGDRPPEWLNSLALIGRRLLGEAYTYGADQLYATSPQIRRRSSR